MSRRIIIGDIHGCYEELMALLDQIGPTDDDEIISLGDFVDRGLDSVKVYQFLRESPNTVSLVGNHERKHIHQTMSYTQEISRLQFGDGYELARSWMQDLPYYIDDEYIIVVHAAMVPGVPLKEQKEEVLCGSMSGEKQLNQIFPDQEWYEAYSDSKPIVFGHKVVGDDPLVLKDKIYGLDTGACHGGRLTALTVPDFKLYSVKAKEDYWNISKRRFQDPVLKSKPWESMKWEKLEQEIGRFQKGRNEHTQQFVSLLMTWRDELLNVLSQMADEMAAFVDESIERRGENGFRDMAKSHPLRSVIFQHLNKDITAADLKRKFQTPADLLDAASHLKPEFYEKAQAVFHRLREDDE